MRNFYFGIPAATAHIRGGAEAPNIKGVVSFYPAKGGTIVVADISGLPQGQSQCSSGIFGFHIHEGRSCEGASFEETGSHYNPASCPHPYHAGDLPPLFECSGKAFLAMLTDRFEAWDIIGRTVVIHSRPDDFATQPSGNAGSKIACGVIRAN